MLIGLLEAVAGGDGRDLLVVLVEDHVLARAVARAAGALADVKGEDGLAAVLLDAEVGRLVGEVDRLEEDRPALVVDDLRALLAGGAGGGDLRRDEDRAGGEVACLQHRDRRRLQLGRVERGVLARDWSAGSRQGAAAGPGVAAARVASAGPAGRAAGERRDVVAAVAEMGAVAPAVLLRDGGAGP